jgi:hypothetical protein
MTRMRVWMIIVLTGSLGVVGWAYAQATNGSKRPVVSSQDYQDVLQHYARFSWGADFRDVDLWLSTFTDDGVLGIDEQRIVGKKALTEWRTNANRGEVGDSKIRHWMPGAMLLTPNPDGSWKARAYWHVLDVDGKPPDESTTGYEEDVLVKTAAGWKFKAHLVYRDAAGK